MLLILPHLLFPAESPYFGSVINISADSTDNVVLVDKSKQQLFVVKSEAPDHLTLLKEYRVTTGQADGNKQREGDMKTPEGIYRVISSISGDRLPAQYGPIALVLNYPNLVDRLWHRTGSNIWIHGRDEAIRDFQTEGCISLENGNILHLRSYIKPNQTPIVIADSLRRFDEQSYRLLGNYWERKLETWADSWENGDTLTYFNFYSPQYNDGGLTFRQFKEKKLLLEKVYDWKSVSVDDIILYYTPGESRLVFKQAYYCPNFYSEGIKQLTLVSSNNAWRIVAESYAPLTASAAPRQFLTAFVSKWQKAWESSDIERYMNLYDEKFQTDEYDYSSWYNYKKEIFQESNRIRVNVSNFTVRNTGKEEWEVSFNQAYQSNDYSDFGRKTLLVHGIPGNLKILTEKWRAITSE